MSFFCQLNRYRLGFYWQQILYYPFSIFLSAFLHGMPKFWPWLSIFEDWRPYIKLDWRSFWDQFFGQQGPFIVKRMSEHQCFRQHDVVFQISGLFCHLLCHLLAFTNVSCCKHVHTKKILHIIRNLINFYVHRIHITKNMILFWWNMPLEFWGVLVYECAWVWVGG